MKIKREFIYFIQAKDAIKIGRTTNIKTRFNTFQAATFEKLRLLGFVTGDNAKEKQIQKSFKHIWITNEWYRPEPDLLEFIRKHNEMPGAFLTPKKRHSKPGRPTIALKTITARLTPKEQRLIQLMRNNLVDPSYVARAVDSVRELSGLPGGWERELVREGG